MLVDPQLHRYDIHIRVLNHFQDVAL